MVASVAKHHFDNDGPARGLYGQTFQGGQILAFQILAFQILTVRRSRFWRDPLDYCSGPTNLITNWGLSPYKKRFVGSGYGPCWDKNPVSRSSKNRN